MSPLAEELVDLMNDTVVLEPVSGPPDKFNNFTFGPAVEVDCYLVRSNKRALNRSGRELISTVQAILADPDLTVTADDRLTLPDGSQPAIIEVHSASDEEGNAYWLEVRA